MRSTRAVIALEAAGVESPRLDAELLLAAAMGVDRAVIVADPGRLLEPDAARPFMDFAARRRDREPVAYILGRKGFRSIELGVDPRVLIPRPETEHLVEAVARPAGGRARVRRRHGLGRDRARAQDGAAGPRRRRRPTRAADALDVARENAARLDLDVELPRRRPARRRRRHARRGRLEPAVRRGRRAARARVVGYEPALALRAGPDGLEVIRRLAARRGGDRRAARRARDRRRRRPRRGQRADARGGLPGRARRAGPRRHRPGRGRAPPVTGPGGADAGARLTRRSPPAASRSSPPTRSTASPATPAPRRRSRGCTRSRAGRRTSPPPSCSSTAPPRWRRCPSSAPRTRAAVGAAAAGRRDAAAAQPARPLAARLRPGSGDARAARPGRPAARAASPCPSCRARRTAPAAPTRGGWPTCPPASATAPTWCSTAASCRARRRP